jgi:hypothetical protein
MKIYKTLIQFGLWLAACLPLASHAAMELPYWLSPDWIASKISKSSAKNTQRSEPTQNQNSSLASDNVNSDNINPISSNTSIVQSAPEPASRKPKLAPVEFVSPKINEKYLSKEELHELRMQLKQKP